MSTNQTTNIIQFFNPKDYPNFRNYDSKELIRAYKVLLHNEKNSSGNLVLPIDIRLYMSRSRSASVVYCNIWLNSRDRTYYNSSGSAGGYGYDKRSAAIADALRNMGIATRGLSGVGESAIRDVIRELCDILWNTDEFTIVTA